MEAFHVRRSAGMFPVENTAGRILLSQHINAGSIAAELVPNYPSPDDRPR